MDGIELLYPTCLHTCRKSIPADITAHMMTSSNGNISRVTGPLCGEFTGHRWISLTKAGDAELLCFFWSTPWINGWVNNREAGDLGSHRAHYDIIVMQRWPFLCCWSFVRIIRKWLVHSSYKRPVIRSEFHIMKSWVTSINMVYRSMNK